MASVEVAAGAQGKGAGCQAAAPGTAPGQLFVVKLPDLTLSLLVSNLVLYLRQRH